MLEGGPFRSKAMEPDEIETGSEPKLPELKLGMKCSRCGISFVSRNEHFCAMESGERDICEYYYYYELNDYEIFGWSYIRCF